MRKISKSHLFGLLTLAVIILIIVIVFSKKMIDTFVDPGRCGIGMPECPNGLRCMNGYCKSNTPPKLPYLSDLPIRP